MGIPPLPRAKRMEIIGLACQGLSQRAIARRSGVGSTTVRRLLRPLGGVIRASLLVMPAGELSLEDRLEIWVGRREGLSGAEIGRRLGRHRSTICRELQRCRPGQYRPFVAHRAAVAAAARPKPTKLATNPMLLATVTAGLEALWSPRQISKVLTELYPGVPSMNISHETIYQSIYVQGRGELRRELARCLRSGRAARQRQHRATTGQGIIPEMVMISQRPAEIEDRAIPGHWEGDLIIGKDGLSAVGTLVERSSRYVILLHLPKGRSADKVRDAMTSAIKELPAHLCRSITWDQGKEMAEHKAFTTATDIQIYFCDPHSPWQRGSNENTNGLLRQYMPKGTDLSAHTPADLQRIADSLNDRPRETLKWATPHNTLHHLLVADTA
jgi:IS30 family transposase